MDELSRILGGDDSFVSTAKGVVCSAVPQRTDALAALAPKQGDPSMPSIEEDAMLHMVLQQPAQAGRYESRSWQLLQHAISCKRMKLMQVAQHELETQFKEHKIASSIQQCVQRGGVAIRGDKVKLSDSQRGACKYSLASRSVRRGDDVSRLSQVHCAASVAIVLDRIQR